jgi:peptide/nickel transport system permease protein
MRTQLGAYVGRRLLALLIILPSITLIVFLLSHFVPADPVTLLVAGGDSPMAASRARADAVNAIRAQYGLNQPLPVQFVNYLAKLIHGDLGNSIMTQHPVNYDVNLYFPTTLELALSALGLILVFGIVLGILAALNRDGIVDGAINTLAVSFVSLPIFWLALMFQLVFYGLLSVLPLNAQIDPVHFTPPTRITGMMVFDALITANWPVFFQTLHHLILPAVTLAIPTTGTVARLVRSSIVEVMDAEFVTVARAKGLRPTTIMLRHILRNALLPTITYVGLSFGGILSGSVFIETIFNFPGLGLYASQSITAFDYQAVMGVTIIAAIIRVLANLFADVVYAIVDPRIAL